MDKYPRNAGFVKLGDIQFDNAHVPFYLFWVCLNERWIFYLNNTTRLICTAWTPKIRTLNIAPSTHCPCKRDLTVVHKALFCYNLPKICLLRLELLLLQSFLFFRSRKKEARSYCLCWCPSLWRSRGTENDRLCQQTRSFQFSSALLIQNGTLLLYFQMYTCCEAYNNCKI